MTPTAAPAAPFFSLTRQPGLVRKVGPRGGKGHFYLNGQECSGVTTATSIIEKPALKGWAAEVGAGYIREQLAPYVERGEPVPPGIFEAAIAGAKDAHKDFSRLAKARGTKVDDHINAHIRARIVARDTGAAFVEPAMPSHVDEPEAVRSINAFLEWEGANDVEWVAFQHEAADPQYLVVGISDWWVVVGRGSQRRPWVGDTKSSKGFTVYDEWALQISANLMVAGLGGTIPSVPPPRNAADVERFDAALAQVGRAVLIADKISGEPKFLPVETPIREEYEHVLRAKGLRQRIPQRWN